MPVSTVIDENTEQVYACIIGEDRQPNVEQALKVLLVCLLRVGAGDITFLSFRFPYVCFSLPLSLSPSFFLLVNKGTRYGGVLLTQWSQDAS